MSTNIYDKVSINKIFAAAKIPRGSFYQYFSGLDDAVITTIEWFKSKSKMTVFDIVLDNDPMNAIIMICELWSKNVIDDPRAFRAWFNMTQAHQKPFYFKGHQKEMDNIKDKIIEEFGKNKEYGKYLRC